MTPRVFVPPTVDAWLDTVTEMDEASLPCNVSTVAYAVNAAALYRRAYRHMLDAFNQLSTHVHEPDSSSQNVESPRCAASTEAANETRTVEVETKWGTCVIDFERTRPGVWAVQISDELIAQAPEMLAQALYSALRKLPPSAAPAQGTDGSVAGDG